MNMNLLTNFALILGYTYLLLTMSYLQVIIISLNILPTLLLVVILDGLIFGTANGKSNRVASFFRVKTQDAVSIHDIPSPEDVGAGHWKRTLEEWKQRRREKMQSDGYCMSTSPMTQQKSWSLFIREMSSTASMPSIHEHPDDTNTSGHHLNRTDGHYEEIIEDDIVLANEKHCSTNRGKNDKKFNSITNIGSEQIDNWISVKERVMLYSSLFIDC